MTQTIIFFHGWGYDASFWDRHIAKNSNGTTRESRNISSPFGGGLGWGIFYKAWATILGIKPPPNLPLRGRKYKHTLFEENPHTTTQISCYNRGYLGEYHKPLLGKDKNICITHSAGLFFAAQEYDLKLFDQIIIYAGFEFFENKASAKAMRLGLKRNPTKILLDFYNACGVTPNTIINPNIQRLSDDLKMIETHNISDCLKSVHYTAFHGDCDTIISTPLKGAKIIANTGHLCNLM